MAHNALHPARLTTINLVSNFFVSNFLVVIFTLAFAFEANATITILSITNSSSNGDLTEATPKVYGGTAGDITAGHGTCPGDGSATCNSCWNNGSVVADARLESCNTNRIYPALQLTITFKSDKVGGRPMITNDETSPTKLTAVGTPAIVAKDETATITVLWSTICAGLDTGGATCVGELDDNLKIGIDKDDDDEFDETNDDSKQLNFLVSAGQGSAVSTVGACNVGRGICEFDTAPGDEKVKVGLLSSDAAFPASQNVPFINVLFFLSTTGFSDIAPDSQYVPLAIESDEDDSTTFSLESEIIDSLTNETKYYFKAAVQDAAMNVGYFTADGSDVDCFLTNNTPPCHSAMPGSVVGILSEDVNCFVATAAYGSSMASQVTMLRKFRNKFLINNKLGLKFVKAYYKYGPYAARFIVENEPLRFAARIALSPFVAFAWVAINYGFLAALALITLLLSIPILYSRAREHQTSRINE